MPRVSIEKEIRQCEGGEFRFDFAFVCSFVPAAVEAGEKRDGDEARRIRRGRKPRRRKHDDGRSGGDDDDDAGNWEDVRAFSLSISLCQSRIVQDR